MVPSSPAGYESSTSHELSVGGSQSPTFTVAADDVPAFPKPSTESTSNTTSSGPEADAIGAVTV